MINNEEIRDKKNQKNPEINNIINENKENREKEEKQLLSKGENSEIIQDLSINITNNKDDNKSRSKDIIKKIKEDKVKSPIKSTIIKPSLKSSKNKIVEDKSKILLNLEPFFSDFNNNIERKGEDIIKEISNDYKDEIYEENKIIFRYGDEADRFFIIYKGEVSLYFPFTEIIDMNIDEFYIYILRLRRYNEIEMLNNVLLLNHGKFMIEFDEGFVVDEYINKLYNTYLKLKYEPTFLYKEEMSKKKKNKNEQSQSVEKNKFNINRINKNLIKNLLRKNRNMIGFDNSKFPTFNEREIKELVLRIGDEILETMKWIMPEKIYNIVEERKEDQIRKNIVKTSPSIIQKYKANDPNNVDEIDYYKRICPIRIHNHNLNRKKIIVMKYLYIKTLTKGELFGDFCPDSLSLFSPYYLSIAKTSRINLKMHKFHHFRNMTAISTSLYIKKNIDKNENNDEINKIMKLINKTNIHLFTFNKKIFFNYFSKYIENKTFRKKNFLLNNALFLNTNNKNLIKTYSFCFKEKKLKDGECLIKEDEKLNEDKIFIYFIKNGEFQANCKKTINQIDEIIKLLGHEKNIPQTFPKLFKDILNTPFYDELVKKPLNLKLNYFSRNDIIGLSEIFKKDEYFYNVKCTKGNSIVYYVDVRIIKLLVDSDFIINNNKNILLYHKYQMLSDILLKQRKIYFDSFFNSEKQSSEDDKTKNITNYKKDESKDNGNDNDNIFKDSKRHKVNMNDLIDKAYNNKQEPMSSNSFISIPKINTIMKSFQSNFNQISKNQSSPNILKNNSYYKIRKEQTEKDHIRTIGDLDKMLANVNSRFTLMDKRIEKNLEFRRKYKEKLEQLEKEKKLKEEEKAKRKKILLSKHILNVKKKGGKLNNTSFYEFKKSGLIYGKMINVLPLLINKDNNENNQLKNEYKLIIPYKSSLLRKSNSASTINPLAYDDFDRNYNTTKYFNLKSNKRHFEKKSLDDKKNNYTIQFKSDIKLNKRKNISNSDILTKKLRNIYTGKLEKILYNESRLKKLF